MQKDSQIAIRITGLKKRYRLGVIGGGTLQGDIQSWWARIRGKEDPNLKIGQTSSNRNDVFMALDGVDLTVCKGERLGIIGHNGAGKSTLLKLLSRVTAPTEGEICIDGRISSMLEVGTGFNPELTGRENIYLNGAILGMSKKEVDAKIDQIIEFSECAQFIDTPVKRYSSGMYVKLAFSVAAHLDSEILVMDEVLAVGDMKFQQKCLGKMSDVSQSEGRTVLYVSHNMNTVRTLCNRCIVLCKGKIIYDGNVDDAINIYMQNEKITEKTQFGFERKHRPNYMKDINRIDMYYFELLNHENFIYAANEQLHFKLKWKAKTDIDNVSLRAELQYADGNYVTTSFVNAFKDAKRGEEYEDEFELDLKYFTPGKYHVTLVMFHHNVFNGKSDDDDVLIKAFSFEVIQREEELEWNTSRWGHVKLDILTKTN